MAKQSGPVKIKGTISGITFYKQNDEYLARQQSSLTGKRVKTDPAFAKTMQEAGIMKVASQLASFVYRQLPKERKRRHYQLLTGQAQQQLRKGMDKDAVTSYLFTYAVKEWNLNRERK
jgi:hypothetical protein